jgi:hypothetical protein
MMQMKNKIQMMVEEMFESGDAQVVGTSRT